MTDCRISKSEVLGPNEDFKCSEPHKNSNENSFDEVFSLLESTLTDLKQNDTPEGLEYNVDIKVKNPVGLHELDAARELKNINSDLNTKIDGLGLDCKFVRADYCNIKNALLLCDNCENNSKFYHCSITKGEKIDGMKCSCKVLCKELNEAKHIQVNTEVNFNLKCESKCENEFICLSSNTFKHLSNVEKKKENSQLKLNNSKFIQSDATGITCSKEDSNDSIKKTTLKEPAVILNDNCLSNKNNSIPIIELNTSKHQNIETNVHLNKVSSEILDEDELLLGNVEEKVNILDVGHSSAYGLKLDKSITEELVDEKGIILSKHIIMEKGGNDVEDRSENISQPKNKSEMALDEKKEIPIESRNNFESPENDSPHKDEAKYECIQNISVCKDIEITNMSCRSEDSEHEDKIKLYCSTPIICDNRSKSLSEKLQNKDFGFVSPLVNRIEEANDLKRKACKLLSIKEEDEEEDSPVKIMKLEESSLNMENSRRSSRKTFEAPAVSWLKKWCPVDEGENEHDYEDLFKSLSELLEKGSTAQEAYEKHVLDENCRDNLKFTEIMQELTQELQDQFEEEDKFLEDVSDNTLTTEKPVDSNKTLMHLPSEENLSKSVQCQILVEKQDNDDNKNEMQLKVSKNLNADNNLSIIYSNDKDKNDDDDEENNLLKEGEFDDKLKKKLRDLEFFISNDPMENEDNANKEWDLLRKLSTDEERYKAVRERWRSLTIPDPKKDLTYRQWRVRNNLPPVTHNKTKTQNKMTVNEPATRMCTVLFDHNIDQILRHLELKRREVRLSLGRELERLAFQQEFEQKQLFLNGATDRQIYNLHCHHVQEVQAIKGKFDIEFDKEQRISHERINALKSASEEVLAFEKYYQGLDGDKADGNKNNLFLTNTEIEELVETECMLEQYDKYYNGC